MTSDNDELFYRYTYIMIGKTVYDILKEEHFNEDEIQPDRLREELKLIRRAMKKRPRKNKNSRACRL